MLSQVVQGSIMENDMNNDTNPALIDMFLEALKMQESSGNYQVLHTPSVIEDAYTGKPVRVQGLGAYGILDINWKKWAKEAGLQGADWHDPKAQDTVAKFKVQQYFDRFNSWDAVSVAWFAGPNKAKQLVDNGTINFDLTDANGQSIKDYVDEMNTKISEEFMTMEVPMETITMPQIYPGPQSNPVIDKQRNNQEVFAAQILDAMTKANAGGNRPSFESQVPAEAGDFADAVVEAKVKRGEIR
tara:strand:- start:13 stop:741 length:729 start_codon:yes stop_codon:yes gene_type:complete